MVVDIPQLPSTQEQAQVVLSISVPEVSLPLNNTRTIIDDRAIDNLVIWAFDENDQFLYQITSEDRDNEGNQIVVQRGNTVYALLPISETNVTLSLIVNHKPAQPNAGTSKATALAGLTFNYTNDTSYIPMYGESPAFIVKEGAKPGNIKLKRALAKLELDASNAWPNFILKSVTIVNSNTKGTVVAGQSITNLGGRQEFKTVINSTSASENTWKGYIPEAINIKDKATRISLILEGINTKDGDGDERTRFYRLDFIKREQSVGGDIEYDYINTIERNKRYAFKIEHIIAGTGSFTFEDALSKDRADNSIINTTLMTINDEEIRDITTDNEYYLGINSSELIATINPEGDGKYYTVNVNVATNNPNGWKIDELPTGTEVTINSFSPGKIDESVTSLWVYIQKEKYSSGATITLYVYSGNIRKTLRIKLQ